MNEIAANQEFVRLHRLPKACRDAWTVAEERLAELGISRRRPIELSGGAGSDVAKEATGMRSCRAALRNWLLEICRMMSAPMPSRLARGRRQLLLEPDFLLGWKCFSSIEPPGIAPRDRGRVSSLVRHHGEGEHVCGARCCASIGSSSADLGHARPSRSVRPELRQRGGCAPSQVLCRCSCPRRPEARRLEDRVGISAAAAN